MIWLAVHPVVAAASSGSANDITPGVLGFLVIAAMAAALFLLLRSMNKHLRRVRAVRDAGLAPAATSAARAAGAAMPAPSSGDGRPVRTSRYAQQQVGWHARLAG